MAINYTDIISEDGGNPIKVLLEGLRELEEDYGSFTKHPEELTEVIRGTFRYYGHWEGIEDGSAAEAGIILMLLRVLFDMKLINGTGKLTNTARAYL